MSDELNRLRTIVGDIETLRQIEGNSVTICCDNHEADEIDKQAAVDVCCDFTDWEERRYHGKTWAEALAAAAVEARSFYAKEDSQ